MIRKVVLFSVGLLVIGAGAAFAAFPAIDLTTLNATYTGADGVVWNEDIQAPTGTGVYNPFLRVQANGTEQGFNTDFGGPYDSHGSDKVPLDDVSGIWTHSMTLGQLQATNVGGTDYYVLHLDINEPNGSPANLLSLDYLKIYTSSDANAHIFSTMADVVANSTLRYDMDGTTDQTVYLNAGLQQGSGKDDLEVLIPTAKFAGAAATDNLILYSGFGYAGGNYVSGDGTGLVSGDGFEEWHALLGGTPPPPPPAPEPTTLLLLGGGALGLVASRRKK